MIVAIGQFAFTPLDVFDRPDLSRNVLGPTLLSTILLIWFPCICVRSKPGPGRGRFPQVCELLYVRCGLSTRFNDGDFDSRRGGDTKQALDGSRHCKTHDSFDIVRETDVRKSCIVGTTWENAGSFEPQTFVYKTRKRERDESYNCGYGSREYSGHWRWTCTRQHRVMILRNFQSYFTSTVVPGVLVTNPLRRGRMLIFWSEDTRSCPRSTVCVLRLRRERHGSRSQRRSLVSARQ